MSPHTAHLSSLSGPSAGRMSPARMLLFVPAALVWALLIVGASRENPAIVGLAIALLLATAGALIVRKARAISAQRAAIRWLWMTGEAGRARVLSLGTRGGGVNGHPRVELELDVRLPGRMPYRTSTMALVCKLAVPRIQPECEIEVRVDPADRGCLLIDEALSPNAYA
jgi:hypothetical protein